MRLYISIRNCRIIVIISNVNFSIDNHHITSIKLYQLDVFRSQEELAEDWSTAKPGVSYLKPPLGKWSETDSYLKILF